MADDWSARIIQGDCVEVMAALDAESVDVVICDPPYGLEFMGKDWDSFADRELVTRTGHERASSGAGWGTTADGSTLPSFGGKLSSYECRVCHVRDAFRKGCRCETPEWRAINPNGTASAVAFERFSLLWAEQAYRVLKPGGHLLAFGGTRTYHRMTVAIEDAGFEIRDSLHWIYGSGFPKSLDVSKQIDKAAGHWRGRAGEVASENGAMAGPNYERTEKGAPVTDHAKEWAGWGTALKPAHEPIVLARKPLAGTVAETVLAHGTGAININGTRVEGAYEAQAGGEKVTTNLVYGKGLDVGNGAHDAGRWPTNVLLAHLPECDGVGSDHTDVLCAPSCPVAELNEMSGELVTHSGTYREDGTAGIYGAKRRAGDVASVGDEGGAARFFYIAKPRKREKVGGTIRNLHPTVKPVELMRYLVRMVTPPGGVILDPFVGSGTTGCAAMVDGFRFVGIEQDPDSHATSLARVSDWAFAHGRLAPVAE